MSRLIVSPAPLPGVALVTRKPIGDSRGFLARLFCADELAHAGWTDPIAQVNHSFTARRGSVRGMHFQRAPHTEVKLVSCLRGSVFDVAVDLRAGSPTFLQWYGEVLTAAGGSALLIPRGFAHGFQTLSNDAELIYCHSSPYVADAEGGIDPFDPRLAIAWPEAPTEMSDRDRSHPRLSDAFEGVHL